VSLYISFPTSFFTYAPFFHTGQAEAGKSTILRNLQLNYAPTAFHAEMAARRAVIDLNLVRSVIFLLNLLEESSPITTTSTADALSGGGGSVDTGPTDNLGRLRVRLSPLRSIEESLARSISPEHCSDFEEVQKNARRVIEACREDIVAFWNHPLVRASLEDHSVSLECQSGLCVGNWSFFFSAPTYSHNFSFFLPFLIANLRVFAFYPFSLGSFLDAVDRITAPGYEPSPSKTCQV
jgi:hypothetical protein